jgi:hypothetical protein
MMAADMPGPTVSRRAPWLALAALGVFGGSGCADKSLISLSAALEAPTVEVTKGTLGSELGGGFDLRMSLGSKASGATEVSLGSFAIVRASDASGLVDPLPVAATGQAFPVTVAAGQTVVVAFQIGGTALLTTAEGDALCAEPVQIIGALTDTLGGDHTISLRTESVTPSCQ